MKRKQISIDRWTQLLLIAISTISLYGCNRRHVDTYEIQNRLYIETFSAGLAGNLTAEYLTDSVKFRIYIGTFDDETEWFYYRFKGDSIYVEKLQNIDETGLVKTIDKKVYNLTDLKKSRSL
jgi:hypothetical protein